MYTETVHNKCLFQTEREIKKKEKFHKFIFYNHTHHFLAKTYKYNTTRHYK